MSRNGGRYDSYYEDYQAPPRRSRREHDEVEVDIRERDRVSDRRRPEPEYLREDYRINEAGPLVRRPRGGREEEIDIDIRERDDHSRASRPRRGGGDREDLEVDIIRREQSRGPPPRRDDYDERDVEFRRVEREPPRRGGRDEEIDINIREEENIRRRPRREPSREREKISININEQERDLPPPRPKSRAVSHGPPARSRAGSDEELDIKYTHRDSPRGGHQDSLVIRERSRSRERSRPAPRPFAREREEFYYRRRTPSPPPPPPPQDTREEIIIRRRRSPSPEPVREPSPEPPPAPDPPMMRPPIVQEIITHHRTIDHGVIRAPVEREPSPPPPPRRERHHDDIDIDIRRRDARGNVYEEDIHIHESDHEHSRPRRREPERRYEDDRRYEEDRQLVRQRSRSRPPEPRSRREETNVNVNIDADFSSSSGAGREVGRPRPPVQEQRKELWTEFTKDMVTREALEKLGYSFDETPDFYYVFARLNNYEVRRLVEISDELKYGRRDRIDQIQWERKDPRLPEPRKIRESRRIGGPPDSRDGWEEVVIERERIYEDGPSGRRRIR